jgi:Delta3-Delta2-enoyl-CoA isomerase
MPTLERHDGDVLVLGLGDTENRFHPDWLASLSARLDEADAASVPRALVVAADGKFFSNGLDLDWLSAHEDQRPSYLASVEGLLARIAALPMVTVAAIQGHAFAAGAMLTLACDFRVMRADRGFWCLPEADIGIPFTPGMTALIQSRLSPRAATKAMLTGRRYGGLEAAEAGVVDQAASADQVLDDAMRLAAAQAAKAGPVLGTIKARMNAGVIAALQAGRTSAPTPP